MDLSIKGMVFILIKWVLILINFIYKF